MRLQDEMPAIAQPENPNWTVFIMMGELGELAHALARRRVMLAQSEPERVNAYLATARIALADIVTQCQLLCEQLGWKYIAVENDGLERFRERMSELKAGTL